MARANREEERRVDLTLWMADGVAAWARGKGRNLPRVEVGRTASRRRLGFLVVAEGKEVTRFALDRTQVKRLRDHLEYQIPRLRNRGY